MRIVARKNRDAGTTFCVFIILGTVAIAAGGLAIYTVVEACRSIALPQPDSALTAQQGSDWIEDPV